MLRYISCAQSADVEVELPEELNDKLNKKGSKTKKNKAVSAGKTYRVVVMGASGVGKSTIISQFLYGRLPDEIDDPDFLNFSELHHFSQPQSMGEEVEVAKAYYDREDTRLSMEMLEVRCDDTESPEWRAAVASGDAFLIVYSIDDDESLNAVNRLRNLVLEQHCYLHLPIVVVANKTDVDDGTRHVENVIAEMVAVEDWGHGHAATSAQTDPDSLNSIFLEMFRQVKFGPDHVMKQWLELHYDFKRQSQKKRTGTFHRLSRRVRNFIGGPQ